MTGGKTGGGTSADQGNMGAKLEDEMNNDHLEKLQEIFQVKSWTKIRNKD